MYRMTSSRPSQLYDIGSEAPGGSRQSARSPGTAALPAPEMQTPQSAAAVRRVLRLVCVLFIVEAALYAAVAPLLPHYAHLLGLSKTAAGVLAATYSAGLIAGSVLGGWLAERLGVRSTTLIGLGLFAAASVAFGLAGRAGGRVGMHLGRRVDLAGDRRAARAPW
jgi:predicted MFS family arabinose efflux permease